MDITGSIRAFCHRHDLLLPGEKILLAVSGGPDSVALAHLLRCLKADFEIELSIAHVNHGLREGDSDEDQHFVEKMACAIGIRCYSERVDVAGGRRKGESVEEAARRLRYTSLVRVLYRLGYDKIATGHTLDDNVETIIYRLLSGTGPGGFLGMLPESSPVIHPLLCVSKGDILAYLHANAVPYRVDRTNIRTEIIRNKIRLEVVPLLQGINPQFKRHMLNFIKILSEENAILDGLVSEQMESIVLEKTEDRVSLNYPAFLKLALALRRRAIVKVLTHLYPGKNSLERFYLPFRVLEKLSTGQLSGNKVLFRNNLLAVKKEYDTLVFTKRLVDTGGRKYLYIVKSFDKPLYISEIEKEVVFSFTKKVRSFEGSKLFIDFGRIKPPLCIRSRKEGDRIRIRGLGTKKIKDLFIDHKVPQEERDSVPVLECEGRLIGVFCSTYGKDNRVAEDCRVTNETETVLVCELREG